MSSPCDNCDSDMCDICGEAQSARKEGRSYGHERKERKYGESPESAFYESGDNTY
jgi:hypothetical protein